VRGHWGTTIPQLIVTIALLIFAYMLFVRGEKTIATVVTTAATTHWLRESVEMRKEEEAVQRRNGGRNSDHDARP
jgi:hypothetical protein